MLVVPPKTLILIPVYNEEENLPPLLAEVREFLGEVPVCVINDGSTDRTPEVLRRADCRCLHLACNLGVGGAMQAGFHYAVAQGFDYVIRLDGDGQHPPRECAALIERMTRGDVDLVVGSRFLGERVYRGSAMRQLGIRGLGWLLSLTSGQRITDPTSGFQMMNRRALGYFAREYPSDYPEPESLARLSRQGYRFAEVPAVFRVRAHGVSSIPPWGALWYTFRVGVALLVDRARPIDPRFDRREREVMP
jgi:glycosyltransferase involved in cell wall biosynthesis